MIITADSEHLVQPVHALPAAPAVAAPTLVLVPAPAPLSEPLVALIVAEPLTFEVVPDAEVFPTAEKIARRLAEGPTRALGGIKRLIADGEHRGLAEHLDAEAASIAASAGHPEGREGVTAFNERRRPLFR